MNSKERDVLNDLYLKVGTIHGTLKALDSKVDDINISMKGMGSKLNEVENKTLQNEDRLKTTWKLASGIAAIITIVANAMWWFFGKLKGEN